MSETTTDKLSSNSSKIVDDYAYTEEGRKERVGRILARKQQLQPGNNQSNGI